MSLPARVLGERGPLRKFLGSKEHQDSLKIYLNAAKIITAQDFKTTQRKKPVPVLYGKKHMPVLLGSLLHRTLSLIG